MVSVSWDYLRGLFTYTLSPHEPAWSSCGDFVIMLLLAACTPRRKKVFILANAADIGHCH